ncbi:MAG: M36 family metallopeptidase [Acidobacteriota bacterium]
MRRFTNPHLTAFTLGLLLSLMAFPAGAIGEPLSGPTKAAPSINVKQYLEAQQAALGLMSSDLADLKVQDSVYSQHNGLTHLYLKQRLDGIPVANRVINFNIAADGRILSFGNQMVPDLLTKASSRAAALAPEAAIASAAQHFGIFTKAAPLLLETEGGPTQKTLFAGAQISRGDISAELAYFAVSDNDVRLVWELAVDLPDGSFYGNVWVDAMDGSVVQTANWIAFDSYKVYEIPKESPLDGPRTTVVDPADATASPFAWHDTNGVAGAEFTDTRGNNVFAQEDLDGNNVGGFRPDGGPTLDFDFPLDLTMPPSSYLSAAITNLFYMNNIMHDVLYQYGFDEPAGNFQQNNYGNGGNGNDAVRADAQDGSGFNNANFATPGDGVPPRMQMFVWKPPIDSLTTVNAPAGIAGGYIASSANFGPQFDVTGAITGDVEVVNDGVGVTSDGCENLVGFTPGRIAFANRGACPFAQKVFRAQTAGAIAVIIANNVAGAPIHMGPDNPPVFANQVNIPSLMIDMADGATIQGATGVNATLDLDPNAPPWRDSDLDNGIIAHEYGHGLSNRLTGGRFNSNCLNTNLATEQAGEGWSDWLTLHFTAVPTDTATTPIGIGNYVIFEPATGPGIRNFPYTTDLAVNPQTYEDIGSTNIPHGVGEIWAAMLWEMYWRLVERDGFDPDLYAGSGGNNLALQLSIDGMKIQPCLPGFVDARDAILAADAASSPGGVDGVNECLIWKAFAKRGLGASAVQGNSNVGNETEAFDIPASCQGLVLSNPNPGVAGMVNDFNITGATPNQKVQLLASRQNNPTTLNITGCGPITFGIGNGIARFGRNGATQFGDTQINKNIVAGVSGSTIHFQALDYTSCTISNVISFTFP